MVFKSEHFYIVSLCSAAFLAFLSLLFPLLLYPVSKLRFTSLPCEDVSFANSIKLFRMVMLSSANLCVNWVKGQQNCKKCMCNVCVNLAQVKNGAWGSMSNVASYNPKICWFLLLSLSNVLAQQSKFHLLLCSPSFWKENTFTKSSESLSLL